MDQSQDTTNYKVGVYDESFRSKSEAVRVLRMERCLETVHEGIRFFDLVHWGIADKVINAHIVREEIFRSHS